MKNSSRHFVRTACAVALVLSCGIGIAAAQPAIIVERGVMPAPRVEVIPVAPGAGYNWVPGHWAWRERGWVWIAGPVLGLVCIVLNAWAGARAALSRPPMAALREGA